MFQEHDLLSVVVFSIIYEGVFPLLEVDKLIQQYERMLPLSVEKIILLQEHTHLSLVEKIIVQ